MTNKRFTVKKIPDEQVYYNFDDQVELDLENVVICGNTDFISYGDKTLIDIINGDYYDDEVGYDYDTFEMLEKITGKKWERTTIKGYSQGDWQEVYFTKEVSQGYLEEIETFYMGKVSEFVIKEDDDDYYVFVPHDIVWEGKDSICRYLDLQPEDTVIYVDDGYDRVYRYKEIN